MSTQTQTRPVAAAEQSAFFVETFALARRRLSHLRRTPGRLVGVVMNPLVLLLAVGYLFENAIATPSSGRYIDYLMAGVLLQVGLASIGPTAISVAMDLKLGMMDRFRSLPISRAAVTVGHSLSDTVTGIVGVVLVSLVGLALGWRPHGDPWEIGLGFLTVIVFVHAMVWVGILLGQTVRNLESIDSIGALVLVVFSFLSNAVFPAQAMPQWIQPFVEWNPTSATATWCRQLWGLSEPSGEGFVPQHPGLVALVAVGTLLVAAVWASLRRFRRSAS
ncbi:ABC transporter permease [Actinoplanes sp. NPDC051346]|uniref:ABC transporter permease n=1 Tax=Actinoplanes sp. NPDC051346 TaxID=3155048 RepID=UPI00341A2B46